MEVGAEAKRIMVVALGKLYTSRSQRGGLRLHRSLLLTLVMKSARDMYHSAALEEEYGAGQMTEEPHNPETQCIEGENFTMDEVSDAVTQPEPVMTERTFTHALQSRKRRGNASIVPDFLPLKKAKLEFVVLVDYVTCGDLGASPSPIPVPMAIAAC
ncbi:unnamed protein product [Knipowitschia caucasica]|uniref:Uncharacterized protein n=1 Tax=Knipowitschia caucasica TaxID=637954 RepID=A0AAV2KM36_KNICA